MKATTERDRTGAQQIDRNAVGAVQSGGTQSGAKRTSPTATFAEGTPDHSASRVAPSPSIDNLLILATRAYYILFSPTPTSSLAGVPRQHHQPETGRKPFTRPHLCKSTSPHDSGEDDKNSPPAHHTPPTPKC